MDLIHSDKKCCGYPCLRISDVKCSCARCGATFIHNGYSWKNTKGLMPHETIQGVLEDEKENELF